MISMVSKVGLQGGAPPWLCCSTSPLKHALGFSQGRDSLLSRVLALANAPATGELKGAFGGVGMQMETFSVRSELWLWLFFLVPGLFGTAGDSVPL